MWFICGFPNLAKNAEKYAEYVAHIIDMSGLKVVPWSTRSVRIKKFCCIMPLSRKLTFLFRAGNGVINSTSSQSVFTSKEYDGACPWSLDHGFLPRASFIGKVVTVSQIRSMT